MQGRNYFLGESILEFSNIMRMPIREQEVLILQQKINNVLFQILFNISLWLLSKLFE
uniref:Uncharacterized protein n=1 Tax=Bartonella rochalimae ATCC BAA-1498 TaxID=685782 RepID=E6YKR7_9HYPH|nr:hypothetical protein BARRO_30036 [Bartonella rochalimae ATCC BAA-1498]